MPIDMIAQRHRVNLFQLQSQTVHLKQAQNRQRGAAQRERIFRPGRPLFNTEEPDQRIQLVRQRHCHRHGSGRHVIALPNRLVMIADGVGHGIGQAFRAGVVAAHDALKLRKFADHFGDEVSLGKTGGPFGLIRVGAFDDSLFHQPAGELGDAVDLVRDRSQFLMEGDALQLLCVIGKASLAVLFPEEARVGETGGEHLAVARDDRRAAILRFDVRGADEGGSELPCGVAQHEIFLVDAQGELDHLRRHFEEDGVKIAQQRHRPFCETRIFRDQSLVLDYSVTMGQGCLSRLRFDDRLPFLMRGDDMAGAQLFDIVLRAADGHFVRVVEAVAERREARPDALDLHVDQILAQNGDDALKRADPAQAFGGLAGRAPAHRLGPWESTDDGGDGLRQHVGGGAARLVHHGEPDAVAVLKLVLGQTRLAQETVERLWRRGCAWPLMLFADRLRFERQAARDEGEAAGRDEAVDGGGGQACLAQFLREETGEIFGRLHLHTRRNFLAAQFE